MDLSRVCHNYLSTEASGDFVLYYFTNQYAWNFFPPDSREKIRKKLTSLAKNYRIKHPNRDLKVPFWPKAALAGFQGMNNYDPRFGETFYSDSFHSGIAHEDILIRIHCDTYFLKAKTNYDNELLMAALSEEDVLRVKELISNCQIIRFHCGHGIHLEKSKQFIKALLNI